MYCTDDAYTLTYLHIYIHMLYTLECVPGNYFLNTSGAFQLVWSLFKPLVPKKILAKTHVLGSLGMLDHFLNIAHFSIF